MRTTLTLDDDVAALLTRVQETRKVSFKRLVNEALRQGLQQMTQPNTRRPPYRTPSVSVGECLVGSIDNVAEVLAIVEGEAYR
jgi:hypothetical protein